MPQGAVQRGEQQAVISRLPSGNDLSWRRRAYIVVRHHQPKRRRSAPTRGRIRDGDVQRSALRKIARQ